MYLEMHFSICNLIFFSVSFKFIYFNWRIITLHYCDGFCYTSTWISHRYTRVPPPSWTPFPPPSLSYPSRLSQSTGFVCPALCKELSLVICFTYGNVYVSKLFSQIIPPSPSATESESLFFTSVSPLLPCMSDYQYHLSKFSIYVCNLILRLTLKQAFCPCFQSIL